MRLTIEDFSLFGNEEYQAKTILDLKTLALNNTLILKMSSSTYLATTLYKINTHFSYDFDIYQGYEPNDDYSKAQVILTIQVKQKEA